MIRFAPALALMLLSSAAFGQHVQQRDSNLGKVLTDDHGMTLYTSDREAGGKVECVGPCTRDWRPLIAEESGTPSGPFTLVERPDGKRQWAYKGQPLYRWRFDYIPGDTGGEWKAGVWHAVLMRYK